LSILVHLEILEKEVSKALKNMTMGKAVRPDGIVTEMLVALNEFGIKRITRLANKIYEEGHFPTEMCKSVFIN